ncbi:arylamine N-acetyltransferase [Mycolicibacterium sp. CAU 1645]|uniref:Arylamine N-acetyltransferase n=2 Tax=Mycolicibacterium arenosum TaxID=2952157 RepID=A0ABT1M160_9MYCO|nr:arylamine N-acetyltransferase [Mycolicibacterium sp. CAU 1645]MCP9272340.1 arylamine N-acetyltransferase [Mycolicibacterium sp. CAU 1645]
MSDVAESVDPAAYFARIGYSGPTDATETVLRDLVAAHGRTIPFENLDPLMGVPVDLLGPTVLAEKLIERRRGGYCYEHNGLVGFVLEALGYGVERLAGRVVWMRDEDAALPAMTHNVLAVTVPGEAERFLVDVGFGGQTLSSPIRLVSGRVQRTRHEPYRIVDAGAHLVLEALVRDTWLPLYLFTTDPRPRIDLEVGSWYVSTHPASTFVVGLSAALVTDEARYNLRGRNLAIHHPDGSERIRFDTAGEVLDALGERFNIDVDDLGERAVVEARVTQVLDN